MIYSESKIFHSESKIFYNENKIFIAKANRTIYNI